jgi:hypothetical protein
MRTTTIKYRKEKETRLLDIIITTEKSTRRNLRKPTLQHQSESVEAIVKEQ